MVDNTPQRIIDALGLKPHPLEGGWFAETYRCDEGLEAAAVDGRYGGPRTCSTAIYYLLTHDTFSEMHRLRSDEIFHHYLGDAVEILLLHPDGSGECLLLGTDFTKGERPQVVVPRGVWQGARLLRPAGYALLGTTVAPGFEVEDYESGNREDLCRDWPAFAEKIEARTHP